MVKWQLLDQNGVGISDSKNFGALQSDLIACDPDGSSSEIDYYVHISNSDLQYLGNGNWQYNWGTSKTEFKGKCRNLYLNFANGDSLTPNFKFK